MEFEHDLQQQQPDQSDVSEMPCGGRQTASREGEMMVDFMNPSDDVLVALGIGRDESAAELAERDARLSTLEAENAGLRARVAEESAKADVLRDLLSSREDAYQEHAAVMDLLTADDALCRLGFVEAFEVLKARADDALSEPPAPLRLGRGPTPRSTQIDIDPQTPDQRCSEHDD